MSRLKLRFVRELQVALITLMLVTLVIAGYFNSDVHRLGAEVERTIRASAVLQAYQEVSGLVLTELVVLSNSVLLGDSSGLSNRKSSDSTLRDAISRLREGIAADAASGGSTNQGGDAESLIEIERMVEELIRSSQLIQQALEESRSEDARNELDLLRNAGFADHFSSLVATAEADRKRQLPGAERKAAAVSLYVKTFLPTSMIALVAITLLSTFFFSRRLTRSLNALYEGVQAYRKGDLEHRIPELNELEFQRLGEAFNTMANQLSKHRKELRETNAGLEATVAERTRSLQASNKRLAEADANRRKLLADISHEFRTPLTVIRGEAEIALRGSGKTEEDYRESFLRIMDQADNTTRLVDDLLFMARADAGEPRLKLGSVAVAEMVVAVCQEFSARAEQRQISISQGRMDAKAFVRGDAGRLRQVLAILMDNALRYSNPGGRVEVRVLKSAYNVEIIIRDQGIGLSEEQSELVFERFYRAPNAEAQASGTGLGLPVAKAIVEAHKGSISLTGTLGEGATATVVLPIGNTSGISA